MEDTVRLLNFIGVHKVTNSCMVLLQDQVSERCKATFGDRDVFFLLYTELYSRAEFSN